MPAMHIQIESLSKRFGKIDVLDQVSLEIAEGKIVAILGPNGAGKTTFLRSLAGIVAPDKGRILYDGQVFTRDRVDLRKQFFFLPDFPLAFGDMRILEHIAMCVRLYDAAPEARSQRVVDLLENFDLLSFAEAWLGTLSRGQFYKAVLSGFLAVDPQLWIVDEPFASGMDPTGILHFREEARSAAARGRTIVYSTQILEIAEKFADVICILDHGRILYMDSPARLREEAGGDDRALIELFRRLRSGQERE
ncbi:MAG: ABC transporter ATP-binding protein [Candidatus Acidiferrum sp.]|jgi:ABC-type multidrug transport system ATPase subunit